VASKNVTLLHPKFKSISRVRDDGFGGYLIRLEPAGAIKVAEEHRIPLGAIETVVAVDAEEYMAHQVGKIEALLAVAPEETKLTAHLLTTMKHSIKEAGERFDRAMVLCQLSGQKKAKAHKTKEAASYKVATWLERAQDLLDNPPPTEEELAAAAAAAVIDEDVPETQEQQ
jgi:hypothetical protein